MESAWVRLLTPTGIPLDTSGRCEIDLSREPGFGWRLSDEAMRDRRNGKRQSPRASELLARGVLVGSP